MRTRQHALQHCIRHTSRPGSARHGTAQHRPGPAPAAAFNQQHVGDRLCKALLLLVHMSPSTWHMALSALRQRCRPPQHYEPRARGGLLAHPPHPAGLHHGSQAAQHSAAYNSAATAQRTFLLRYAPRAWHSPMVVVLLPSPSGVGLMPATHTARAHGTRQRQVATAT